MLSAGGRLDKIFCSALDLPAGMRVLLYLNHGDHSGRESLINPSRSAETPETNRPADKIASLIEAIRQNNQEMTALVHWSSDRADDELFHAIPLQGTSNASPRRLLGILLVGNSRDPMLSWNAISARPHCWWAAAESYWRFFSAAGLRLASCVRRTTGRRSPGGAAGNWNAAGGDLGK